MNQQTDDPKANTSVFLFFCQRPDLAFGQQNRFFAYFDQL